MKQREAGVLQRNKYGRLELAPTFNHAVYFYPVSTKSRVPETTLKEGNKVEFYFGKPRDTGKTDSKGKRIFIRTINIVAVNA